MKKIIIVLLILLAVGIALGAVGAIIIGGENKVQTQITKTETYSPSKSIRVRCSSADVIISIGQENQVTFDYIETKSHKGKVTVTDTEILFEYGSNKFINFDWLTGKKKVNVTLPANFSGNLTLDTATGRINADLLSLDIKDLNIFASTGEVNLSNANIKGDLSVSISTGMTTIEDFNVGKRTIISASTGDIRIKNLFSGEDVSISAATSKVKADGVSTLGKFTSILSTGRGIYNVNCSELSLSSTTGSIDFTVSGAKNITVKASTGDIKGSIDAKESDFGNITYKTSTGFCNLPFRTGSGNSLLAETTTGDITIYFTKQ